MGRADILYLASHDHETFEPGIAEDSLKANPKIRKKETRTRMSKALTVSGHVATCHQTSLSLPIRTTLTPCGWITPRAPSLDMLIIWETGER